MKHILTTDIDMAKIVTIKHAIHIVEAASTRDQAVTALYSWLVELEGDN